MRRKGGRGRWCGKRGEREVKGNWEHECEVWRHGFGKDTLIITVVFLLTKFWPGCCDASKKVYVLVQKGMKRQYGDWEFIYHYR